MAARYFNWKLAVTLVIGIAVLGATAFGLRQWQRSTRAEQGLSIGTEAYDNQNWEEAALQLGRYLTVQREDVNGLMKYAEANLKIVPAKRNQIQQAIAAYRTILRIDPNNAKAATELSSLYLALGMPGESELIARRYLENKEDYGIRTTLAGALAAQRKFNEATTELKSVLAKDPNQIQAYEALGRLAEQWPESMKETPSYWYDAAVKQYPSSPLAHIARADYLLRIGDEPNALADLTLAETQDLSDLTVRLRLARSLILAKQIDKAESHLKQIQAAEPTNEALWQTWAQLAFRSGSQAKMLDIAESGLKTLARHPWGFMTVAAELFIRGNNLQRAKDCITQLDSRGINPEHIAFLNGLVSDSEGNTTEAIKHWQRAIELGSKSPTVRLAIASALVRSGDMSSAFRHLRAVVSEQPDYPAGWIALARLSAQTGNWTEAVEHSRKAVELAPKDTEAALLHLQCTIQAQAASRTGIDNQALQTIEQRLSEIEKSAAGGLQASLIRIDLALQRKDMAAAERLLAQAKQAYPEDVRVAMAQARLLADQDKLDEAVEVLNAATKQSPQAPEPAGYLAALHERKGDREQCEKALKDAMGRIKEPQARRDMGLTLVQFYTLWKRTDDAYTTLLSMDNELPGDILIKRRLLRCEQVIKDSKKGQQLVDQIKSIEGDKGWQWRFEQARTWYVSEQFEARQPQIISLLKENLQTNPDDQDSRLLLAATYQRAGKLQTAVSTYREALNRSPDDIRIIAVTVAALYEAKEYSEAEKILDRAAQQSVQDATLQRLQLEGHLRRGELSSASAILQQFISTDPNDVSSSLALTLLKMRQKEFKQAGELLAQLQAREPNSLPITAARIQLHLYQSESDKALELCSKVINDLNNPTAYILRARTFALLNQPDKAAQDLERAVAIEPNNIDPWVAKSDFYFAAGQLDKAIADIEHALSLDPNNVMVQKRAVALLWGKGRIESTNKAKHILDQALQANPNETDLLLLKVRMLMADGTAPSLVAAEEILRTVNEDQPTNVTAWLLMGEVMLAQDDPGKAIDAALRGLVRSPNDKALMALRARASSVRSPILSIPILKEMLAVDPNDAVTAIRLANAYVGTGEPAKAIELMTAQLTRTTDPAARRMCGVALAVALHRAGKTTEAQQQFNAVQQSDPNDPSVLLAQMQLLMEQNLWEQVRQALEQWSRNHPKDVGTMVAAASLLSRSQEAQAHKTAEEMLGKAAAANPDSAAPARTLAVLLQSVNRPVEAAEWYAKVLAIEPNDVIAMNNLAWILCEEKKDYQKALALADKGLKIAPNYVDLIDTRGMVYYRMGEFAKAAKDFTTAISFYYETHPSVVTSRFHLARALAKLGEKDKATEQLKKVLDAANAAASLSPTDLTEAHQLLDQLSKGAG
jgi:tetratricopeptide (TPR) repeat protein